MQDTNSKQTLYDASRNWSDAQWARFLQCDKKEIPSIRRYVNGNDDQGRTTHLSGLFIEQTHEGYEFWFHFANFYCYSSQKPFKTSENAESAAKDFLMRLKFNATQQKLLDIPKYAAMMMNIHKVK